MITRRQFNKGLVYSALSGLAFNLNAKASLPSHATLGELIDDPKGILSLPAGFSYQVISQLGDTMDDGMTVPNRSDGMGCFALDSERVVLVRNHELEPRHTSDELAKLSAKHKANSYDHDNTGRPLPGGTSNIVYNHKTRRVEQQFMSLLGTIRNCSGGITPWGSWLTCEESVDKASQKIAKDHGYVFEIPSTTKGLVNPQPIKAMGRFNHEAACVDPATGIVYLTEDRNESLFYRFIPNKPGELHQGGKLQALAIKGAPQFDSRNWQNKQMDLNHQYLVEWIDLENVTSPNDDLRFQGHKKGAALFARGEGIIFGDNEMYFCCTSGGAKQVGQIMRYSLKGNAPTISLFLESEDISSFNYGDNLVIAPNGHLVVCEDQYTDNVNNHLKGVTPKGATYDFAKVEIQTEPAGVCFSPDGETMFVNLYSPSMTLAITGPWDSLSSAG